MHSVYCYLRSGEIVRTQVLTGAQDVHIDRDAAGRPVGVEILNVQRLTIDGIDVHL
jgi:uncharacterized protein YuzE